jgi:hypothetical protein
VSFQRGKCSLIADAKFAEAKVLSPRPEQRKILKVPLYEYFKSRRV